MKTLSDHPMLIARLLAADKRRRERKAARERFWRSPDTTLWLSILLLWLVASLFWEIDLLR